MSSLYIPFIGKTDFFIIYEIKIVYDFLKNQLNEVPESKLLFATYFIFLTCPLKSLWYVSSQHLCFITASKGMPVISDNLFPLKFVINN
jgi:hypothetical protein